MTEEVYRKLDELLQFKAEVAKKDPDALAQVEALVGLDRSLMADDDKRLAADRSHELTLLKENKQIELAFLKEDHSYELEILKENHAFELEKLRIQSELERAMAEYKKSKKFKLNLSDTDKQILANFGVKALGIGGLAYLTGLALVADQEGWFISKTALALVRMKLDV